MLCRASRFLWVRVAYSERRQCDAKHIAAVALVVAAPVASAQNVMSPQQYHKEKGPCACPGDKDKVGHLCGKRSAFCRSGGAEVQCFRAGDIEKRKKEACGAECHGIKLQ